MKAQVEHLPLAYKGLRPTQGRTLAVMQVSAGSQSFNSISTLGTLGRWMRKHTIPNQTSVGKAYGEETEGQCGGKEWVSMGRTQRSQQYYIEHRTRKKTIKE